LKTKATGASMALILRHNHTVQITLFLFT